MPFFKMKLTVNQEVLNYKLRELPARAKRIFRNKMQTEIRPILQEYVDNLFPELVPDGPISPFIFGSDASRKYYFWLIGQDDTLTDGSHWIRTGDIENAWEVRFTGGIEESLFTIANVHPRAKYVYGPFQVASHKLAGWGDELEIARQLIEEEARKQIIRIWRDSFQLATKGVDA